MLSDEMIHEKISALIADVSSQDKGIQRQACVSLGTIGPAAIDPLLTALTHPNEQVRAHVVRLLGELGDPRVAPQLVYALEDRAVAVRWLAAESLVRLGREGLLALLPTLVGHSDSVWLRRGAHHVLRDLAVRRDLREVVKPVLAALESTWPVVAVPGAATAALNELSPTGQRLKREREQDQC